MPDKSELTVFVTTEETIEAMADSIADHINKRKRMIFFAGYFFGMFAVILTMMAYSWYKDYLGGLAWLANLAILTVLSYISFYVYLAIIKWWSKDDADDQRS